LALQIADIGQRKKSWGKDSEWLKQPHATDEMEMNEGDDESQEKPIG
jgi:hypothetical protein